MYEAHKRSVFTSHLDEKTAYRALLIGTFSRYYAGVAALYAAFSSSPPPSTAEGGRGRQEETKEEVCQRAVSSLEAAKGLSSELLHLCEKMNAELTQLQLDADEGEISSSLSLDSSSLNGVIIIDSRLACLPYSYSR